MSIEMALRNLRLTPAQDALKLEALRLQIKQGARAVARGDFTEVDDSELERFVNGLGSRIPKHPRK